MRAGLALGLRPDPCSLPVEQVPDALSLFPHP